MEPVRRGLVGAAIMLSLALPWEVYHYLETLPAWWGGSGPVDNLVGAGLHWAVLGFVFGYAYPWLRGDAPVGKAVRYLLVVLPLQLLPLWSLSTDGFRLENEHIHDLTLTTVWVSGVSVSACLVLGLYWEWRLVNSAGLRWGEVREFGRISALGAPTAALVAAVMTAVGAAIGGVWATELTAPAHSGSSNTSTVGGSTQK